MAVNELDQTLQRLEATLGERSGPATKLEGGITNSNFRLTLGGEDYVVRVHGRDTALLGIDRDAERLASGAAAALGIAPAVSLALPTALVTRFVACRSLDAHEIADSVEQIASMLRRFHDSGVVLPVSFSVPDLLQSYQRIVLERGGSLPADYAPALALATTIAAALPVREPRPCHNDLLSGNIIRARDRGELMIVDWEYAGMGSVMFDLANLSINNGFDAATDERLLQAYLERAPSSAETARLKLMRILSDAREAAWGVVQGQLSELDFDFAGYAARHFRRLRDSVDAARLDTWLAAAGAPAQRRRPSGGDVGQAA